MRRSFGLDDPQAGHAAKVGMGAQRAAQKVLAALGRGSFGIGEIGGAQRHHKQLTLDALAAVRLDVTGLLARVVDEELVRKKFRWDESLKVGCRYDSAFWTIVYQLMKIPKSSCAVSAIS